MKWRNIFYILLLVCVTSNADPEDRDAILKKAWELFNAENFEEAIRLGEQVYQEGEEYSSALLGLAYMKMGDCEKALDRISYLEGWLDLNMDSVDELARKEDAASRKVAAQAKTIHEKVKLVSGYCNNEINNWLDSVSGLKKYIEYEDGDPDVLPILGESYMRLAEQSYKGAISAFKKYLSMEGAKEEVKEGAKFALAQVYVRTGDIKSAVQYSISLLSGSPTAPDWLSRMKNNPDFRKVLTDKKMKAYIEEEGL